MSDSRCHIRAMAFGDEFDVAQVHVNAWRAAYAGIVPEEVLSRLSVERRAAYYRREVEQQLVDTIVAVVDDRIAGFASFGQSRDEDAALGLTAELWALYVAPERWRQGIGRQLIDTVAGELIRREFERLTLWVLARNASACRFYERMGFALDGCAKSITIGVPLMELRYGMGLLDDNEGGAHGSPAEPAR